MLIQIALFITRYIIVLYTISIYIWKTYVWPIFTTSFPFKSVGGSEVTVLVGFAFCFGRNVVGFAFTYNVWFSTMFLIVSAHVWRGRWVLFG